MTEVQLDGYTYVYEQYPNLAWNWDIFHPHLKLNPYPAYIDPLTKCEYGTCCFCGGYCNVHSQSCGICNQSGGSIYFYHFDPERRIIYKTQQEDLDRSREVYQIHTGPRGGLYRLINGRRRYL